MVFEYLAHAIRRQAANAQEVAWFKGMNSDSYNEIFTHKGMMLGAFNQVLPGPNDVFPEFGDFFAEWFKAVHNKDVSGEKDLYKRVLGVGFRFLEMRASSWDCTWEQFFEKVRPIVN